MHHFEDTGRYMIVHDRVYMTLVKWRKGGRSSHEDVKKKEDNLDIYDQPANAKTVLREGEKTSGQPTEQMINLTGYVPTTRSIPSAANQFFNFSTESLTISFNNLNHLRVIYDHIFTLIDT